MIGPKVVPPTKAEEKRAYVMATRRDSNICQRCRRDCGQGVTSRDHRKGRGVGGVTTVANLQILGGTGTTGCHGWKCSNPKLAEFGGWSVPGWADPLEWPAARWFPTGFGTWRLGWCLYSNDGLVVEISEGEARRRMQG